MVSGDIHFSQLLRKDCRKITEQETTFRPLYEVTTSGMTHSWGSKYGYCGRSNGSKLCKFPPFFRLLQTTMHYSHWVVPWNSLLRDETTQKKQYSLDRNVAEFEFDWDNQAVHVNVLGEEGRTLLYQHWPMNRLTTLNATNTRLEDKDFEMSQERLETSLQQSLAGNDFVCVDYRGNINPFHMGWSMFTVVGFFFLGGMLPFVICLYLLNRGARQLLHNYKKHKARNALKRSSSTDEDTTVEATRFDSTHYSD